MVAFQFLSLFLLLPTLANAGHADMFSCRKGKCPVTELTDANFDIELASPSFVMFYAPWCGHCKQLAPVLKKAAKTLEQSGVKVAAIDVEPNPTVQGKFPDIRGFPTLKFLPSSNPKKAVDYQGGRDEQSIVEFAKQQAKKHGVVMGEPVVNKDFNGLYSFMGRSALENKPVLLVIDTPSSKSSKGKEEEASNPPSWIGKIASELRKGSDKKDATGGSKEVKTKELLKEASRTTKLDTVRDGISSLLDMINNAESSGSASMGPSVISPVYSTDVETMNAFNLVEADLPVMILASIDRKTAKGSYIIYPDEHKHDIPPPDGRKGKNNMLSITQYINKILPILNQGPHQLSLTVPEELEGALPLALPEFPKPPNVLAAEERERKKKEREITIHNINSQETLNEYCYELQNLKTCALFFIKGGADEASTNNDIINNIVKKFSKDGFSFAAIDLNESTANDQNAIQGLLPNQDINLQDLASSNEFYLSIVKNGKRPRVSVIKGDVSSMVAHLDNIVGGSASFTKIKNGLPNWSESSEKKNEL